MIFLTVGTIYPFDRLIKAIDNAIKFRIIKEPVFAQIGKTDFKPEYMQYAKMLNGNEFNEKISVADYIISHAGVGSIITALDNKKPLLVMPRLRKFKEHVNNHQIALAQKFEQLGHILVAYNIHELPDKLEQLKTFVPKPRENQAQAVANRIRSFLQSIE